MAIERCNMCEKLVDLDNDANGVWDNKNDYYCFDCTEGDWKMNESKLHTYCFKNEESKVVLYHLVKYIVSNMEDKEREQFLKEVENDVE